MSPSNPGLPSKISKVYVAGSSLEIERASAMMQALRGAGIEVTSRWPQMIAEVGEANPREAFAKRREIAVAVLRQIREAQLVWFLVPPPDAPTRGGWYELGYGLRAQKLLVCSGDSKASVFGSLAYEFAQDADALNFITTKLATGELEAGRC